MKKIIRRLKLINIDVYIFEMLEYKPFELNHSKYKIEKEELKNGKLRYYIKENGALVHESFLFSRVFLMKSIGKQGPVIGDCKTMKNYRGLSIYPYVINRIAKELLQSDLVNEVFMIVDSSNKSSIKGIEKAGFKKAAGIKAKRWLWFYLKRDIIIYNKEVI